MKVPFSISFQNSSSAIVFSSWSQHISILLNVPLCPIPTFIFFLTLTSTPFFQHWLVYSNSMLFGVSLINLSSPSLKVILQQQYCLFCQIKNSWKSDELCHIYQPLPYQKHTWKDLNTNTHAQFFKTNIFIALFFHPACYMHLDGVIHKASMKHILSPYLVTHNRAYSTCTNQRTLRLECICTSNRLKYSH